MASEKPDLVVQITPRASRMLQDIWQWNAGEYGESHADAYVHSLRTEAESLSYLHRVGRPVRKRSEFRYIHARMKSGRNGHVIVFTVTATTVEILGFFHPRQDWRQLGGPDDPDPA